MSKLRVALVTPGTFAVPSGRMSSVELVTLQAGERLKQQADVVVFGKKTKKQRSDELRGGLRYIRPPARGYIRHVSRWLRKVRPSVVQVENRPKFARYLKRRHPELPVVLSLHSATFISKPHIGANMLRSCLRHADAVVVNSSFLKRLVVAADAASETKVTVNHLGVDTSRFSSRWTEEAERERQAHLQKLGLTGKKIILYVGRLIPIKGVHRLLKAMPAIVAIEPDAVLLLVGSARYGSNRETPYVRRLRRLAKIVKAHVRFVPFVPHADIPKWFRLADVIVVPSASKEAFGLVNVEAMATGVPVVATAAGGMQEIIEHGRTGLLVDPRRATEGIVESVCTVLSDPQTARYLGENGIRRVNESFTWDRTADRLLQLYRTWGEAT